MFIGVKERDALVICQRKKASRKKKAGEQERAKHLFYTVCESKTATEIFTLVVRLYRLEFTPLCKMLYAAAASL